MKRSPMPPRKKAMARKKPMKRTPTARKAPNPRPVPERAPVPSWSTKPKKRKPIRQRSARRPAKRASDQRADCMARDGAQCVFERFEFPRWERCRVRGEYRLQAAHVWRRGEVAHRETIDHVDVVIAACTDCHTRWDQFRRKGLRIPKYAVDRARETINAHRAVSKKLPPIADHVQP